MNSKYRKTAFLLLSNRMWLDRLSAAIVAKNHRVTTEFDHFLDMDLLIIDSFYLASGMAELVREVRPDLPIVLALSEQEMSGLGDPVLLKNFCDMLVLPSELSIEELDSCMQLWVDRLEMFKQPASDPSVIPSLKSA